MATWTKAKLASEVLEFLNVKPAMQAADANDLNKVKGIIDSVHDQLQDSDLAPYDLSAIPLWAQQPMVKDVAFEAGPYFGKVLPEGLRNIARKEMARARFGGPRGTLPTRTKDY